jgi:hypothetical protein
MSGDEENMGNVKEIGENRKYLVVFDEKIDITDMSADEIASLIYRKCDEYDIASFIVVADGKKYIGTPMELKSVLENGDYTTLEIVPQEKAG